MPVRTLNILGLNSVFDRLGTDKLRCDMVTSNGEFVLYKEGVRNSELYVVNIADLCGVITLAEPVREIDAYVSGVIDQVIEFQPW